MPSKSTNWAGREVADDVKAAVKRAIQSTGLEEHKVRMVLAARRALRLVYGGAKPPGWPYPLPPLSVEVFVATNGDVEPASVYCQASDQDPAMSIVGGALRTQDCRCDLVDLPEVLQAVWTEREVLMVRQRAGEEIPSYAGRFQWRWSSAEDSSE